MNLFATLGEILQPDPNPYYDMVKDYNSNVSKKSVLTKTLNSKKELLKDATTARDNGATYYFGHDIHKAISKISNDIYLIKKAYASIK